MRITAYIQMFPGMGQCQKKPGMDFQDGFERQQMWDCIFSAGRFIRNQNQKLTIAA